MLEYMLYTSQATKEMTEEDLNQLKITCHRNNAVHDITGILIYDKGTFIQILEGELSTIEHLKSAIEHDPRNAEFHILKRESLSQRNFPTWHMQVNDISQFSQALKDRLHIDAYPDHMTDNPDKYFSVIIELLDSVLKNAFMNCHAAEVKKPAEDPDVATFRQLSQREKQVLRLLVKGYTAKGIARQLNISDKTAARHTENIRKELNCLSKSDLIVKVFSTGYLHELLKDYFGESEKSQE